MQIYERTNEHVLIFEISGNLMGGPEVQQFLNRLDTCIGNGFRSIIMDLKRVNLVSSAGIGMMVGGVKTVREQGGEVQLACLQDRIIKVLEINRLDSYFLISETVDQAIDHFK